MKPVKLILFICFLTLFSCKDHEVIKSGEGSLELSFQQIAGSLSGRITSDSIYSFIISIADANGNLIYDKKKIEVYEFSGAYISEPLAFKEGSYKLTEFLVSDKYNIIRYATPKQNAKLDYLIKHPLPLDFSIVKDQTSKIIPEVIAVKNGSALDFGYSTFSIGIVKTFDFLISAFVYDASIQNFKLTNTTLTVLSDKDTLYSTVLSDSTNSIKILDEYQNYTIKVTKSGYGSYEHLFSNQELKNYNHDPLIIKLFAGINIADHLIGFYPFTGNANDLSGNNFHGTVSAAQLTTDRNGTANSAYYFNGSAYIDVADNQILRFDNNFTLAAWINSATFKTAGDRIIDKSVGSGGPGFVLDTYNPDQFGRNIRLQCGEGWKYMSPTALDVNKWYFIVASYQDGVGKIYINGKLNNENFSTTVKVIQPSTTSLRFGFDTGVRLGPDYDDSFVGKLDDIRIYNRVLNDSEVMYLYEN